MNVEAEKSNTVADTERILVGVSPRMETVILQLPSAAESSQTHSTSV